MTSCGEVKIGDSVRYEGRLYVVRGFSFLSSPTQHVLLEDQETGERATAPLADIEAARETGDDPAQT